VRHLVCGAVVLILVLAACTSTGADRAADGETGPTEPPTQEAGDQAPPPADLDACALISLDEVGEVIGSEADVSEDNQLVEAPRGAWFAVCGLAAPHPTFGEELIVNVHLTLYDGSPAWDFVMDVGEAEGGVVEGIGDLALWPDTYSGTLNARSGGVVFSVQIIPPMEEETEELARRIVSNLDQ
jgi:hypothetical protein